MHDTTKLIINGGGTLINYGQFDDPQDLISASRLLFITIFELLQICVDQFSEHAKHVRPTFPYNRRYVCGVTQCLHFIRTDISASGFLYVLMCLFFLPLPSAYFAPLPFVMGFRVYVEFLLELNSVVLFHGYSLIVRLAFVNLASFVESE